MTNEFQASLQLDLRLLSGKLFKVVADAIRSGIKNEHGYRATKGINDTRLQTWPIIIRFTNKEYRERFEDVMKQTIHPDLIAKILIKHLKPMGSATRPVRMARG
jgi:hypothetical protein